MKGFVKAFIILSVIVITIFIVGNLSNKHKKQDFSTSPPPTVYFEEKVGALIEDSPYIPTYPDSELIRSYKKQENGKTGYDIFWTSKDPVNKVMKWYQKQLKTEGWFLEQPPDDPDSDGEQQAVLTKDNLLLYLTVENEGGEATEIFAEFPLSK